ncbi:MAG TPA: hypothetical protein VGE01_08430, partial [Fimbriimonas sp.]
MRLTAWPILLLVFFGCGSPSPDEVSNKDPIVRTGSTYTQPPADPWVLATTDPQAPEPAWLSNGLVGIRLGRGGIGYDVEGKSLPFFLADEYETTGEEKIRTLPNPVDVLIDDASNVFYGSEPRDIQDYRQELDMRTGILSTSWTEKLGGSGGTARVVGRTVLHPSKRILAQRWEITPSRDADLAVGAVNTNPDDPWKQVNESGTATDKTREMKGLGPSQV